MSIQKLKQEILNKTREYYNLYHKKNSINLQLEQQK